MDSSAFAPEKDRRHIAKCANSSTSSSTKRSSRSRSQSPTTRSFKPSRISGFKQSKRARRFVQKATRHDERVSVPLGRLFGQAREQKSAASAESSSTPKNKMKTQIADAI